MTNKKRIDTSKCKELGDGYWYDEESDIFYLYDRNMDIYLEVEGDSVDRI